MLDQPPTGGVGGAMDQQLFAWYPTPPPPGLVFEAHRLVCHSTLGCNKEEERRTPDLMPGEFGTYKTVKARFWSWLESFGMQKS